jgi:HPt (histidine-containing phosphotransfer) domain-containing protein
MGKGLLRNRSPPMPPSFIPSDAVNSSETSVPDGRLTQVQSDSLSVVMSSGEFDIATLRETCRVLADEIGADGVAELLQSYLDDTPDRFVEIGRFIASGDKSSLKRAAHSLKGSSSIFGLLVMERTSQRLEHFQAGAGSETEAALLEALRTEFFSASPHIQVLAKEMAESV